MKNSMGLSRLSYSQCMAILLKFWNIKWQTPQLLLAKKNWKYSQNTMSNNAWNIDSVKSVGLFQCWNRSSPNGFGKSFQRQKYQINV